jgi:protein FAM50
MSSQSTSTVPSGDFHKFHRPEAGSRTVEGNTSGARAMRLDKQREEEQKEFEQRKRQRIQENENTHLNIGSKFQPARIGNVEEQAFKAKTVGLVTAEEFMAATNEKDRSGLSDSEMTPEEKAIAAANAIIASKKEAKRTKKRKKDKKKRAALLSFHDDDEEEEEEEGDKVDNKKEENKDDEKKEDEVTTTSTANETKAKLIKKSLSLSSSSSKKDPTIDTSFLPDKDREDAIKLERIRLEKEWKEQQIKIKTEKLEITYSYWDGSGHRRTVTITKGDNVGEFLEIIRKELCLDFRELGSVASDALLYVKEDLILPHDITFYDLIVTKARGKSGPLFHFDVRDDIRMGPLDVRIEKVCNLKKKISLI